MKKLKFDAILNLSKKKEFWESTNLFVFHGNEYPVLFFNDLFSFLKKKDVVSFDRTKNNDIKSFFPLLKQQFLGEKKCYWLGNDIDQSSKKNKSEQLKFLSSYEGPNVVGCFLSGENDCSQFKEQTSCIIELDGIVGHDTCLKLVDFFEALYTDKKKKYIKKFFDGTDGLSLDMVCMLMRYLDVVGIRSFKELEYYVNIVSPFNGSLFLLSQYFFSKNSKSFFALWSKMIGDYPDVFWITYWSDQLWRAHNVVKLLTCGKNREARRFSFRLPYSFANKEWKRTSTKELLHAYGFLFKTDYGLKRGLSFCSLDLFFSKYFGGAFQ